MSITSHNTSQIVFLDLETTGLSPVSDQILEIAMAVYDVKTGLVTDDFDLALTPIRREAFDHTRFVQQKVEEVRAGCDPIVQEMHDKTGLWERCENSNYTLFDAPKIITDWLLMAGLQPGKELLTMGGNGVDRFDRQFLEAYSIPLQNFNQLFHYRSLDVSNLWHAFKIAGVELAHGEVQVEGQKHNALFDCHQSAADYTLIRRLLDSWMDK